VRVGTFLKKFLQLLGIFLFLVAQSAAAEITGKAETMPEMGLIRLQEKVFSLQGIQIIPHDAVCQDNSGQWPCGKTAWQTFQYKLESGPVQCTLITNLPQSEGVPDEAECLQKTKNLNIWLVSQGWALTGKGSESLFSSQEKLARNNGNGLWRDGFIPPDDWRPKFENETKHCNVCSLRRKSFLKKSEYKK
jgi:endonuclease YncB( thermonuclease family)